MRGCLTRILANSHGNGPLLDARQMVNSNASSGDGDNEFQALHGDMPLTPWLFDAAHTSRDSVSMKG